MSTRVYVCIPSWKGGGALDELSEKCEVVVAEKSPTKSELAEIAKEFDGMIIGRLETVDRQVLEGSKLKFVSLIAKGTDNIDIEECRKRGVAVFYTPEANITSVAEHTMALILALAKNIIRLDRAVRNEKFDESRHSTIDVSGKTLGVIGAGPIAEEVIKMAKVFGMNVLCYTPHPEKHNDLEVEFVSLEELLKGSDFVSVNIALAEETKNLISEKELSMMKKTAFLVNTARGRIVDESALAKSLENGEISGAGIDVFAEEPARNSALFELDNVILTPHVAGVSKEALNRMEEHAVSDILAFLDGEETEYRLV